MKVTEMYINAKEIVESLTGFKLYRKSTPWGFNLFNDLDRLFVNWKLDIIFDVGANKGQTALSFYKKWQNSQIYSFEPVSDTFQELQANTYSISNIKAYKLALGSKIGEYSIMLFGNNNSNLSSLDNRFTEKSKNTFEKVQTQTIDNFCKKQAISKIDFLKIDTEGYDLEVLKGCTEMLESDKIDIIFAEFSTKKIPGKVLLSDIDHFLNKYQMICVGIYDQHFALHYGNALFAKQKNLPKNLQQTLD